MMAGATPMRTSVKANEAERAQMTASAAATSPKPPARTWPLRAATTGLGYPHSSLSTSEKEPRPSSTGGSVRSAPEQKVLPVPVIATARTSGSERAATRCSDNSATRRRDSALRLEGESRARTAEPWRSSRLTRGGRSDLGGEGTVQVPVDQVEQVGGAGRRRQLPAEQAQLEGDEGAALQTKEGGLVAGHAQQVPGQPGHGSRPSEGVRTGSRRSQADQVGQAGVAQEGDQAPRRNPLASGDEALQGAPRQDPLRLGDHRAGVSSFTSSLAPPHPLHGSSLPMPGEAVDSGSDEGLDGGGKVGEAGLGVGEEHVRLGIGV